MINVYEYISYNCPNEVDNLLNTYGIYNTSGKVQPMYLQELVNQHGDGMLAKILKLHPDREAILYSESYLNETGYTGYADPSVKSASTVKNQLSDKTINSLIWISGGILGVSLIAMAVIKASRG